MKNILILSLFLLSSCTIPANTNAGVGAMAFHVDFPEPKKKNLSAKNLDMSEDEFNQIIENCQSKELIYENETLKCIEFGDLEVSIK